jgi:hypothetical protein
MFSQTTKTKINLYAGIGAGVNSIRVLERVRGKLAMKLSEKI